MTKDEALRLALEALEWANKEINKWMDDAYGYDPEEHPEIMQAITAIKEALAQSAHDAGVAHHKQAIGERNFCPRCGKRAQGVLGQPQVHTCTPPLWGHT
jgi:NMD protein affecting ribosome stability and mRNA decay